MIRESLFLRRRELEPELLLVFLERMVLVALVVRLVALRLALALQSAARRLSVRVSSRLAPRALQAVALVPELLVYQVPLGLRVSPLTSVSAQAVARWPSVSVSLVPESGFVVPELLPELAGLVSLARLAVLVELLPVRPHASILQFYHAQPV